MGSIIVDGISVASLQRIVVSGGDVLHGMKSEDQGYAGFGEAYFSQIEYGAVKAWKRHLRMTLNLIVPVGVVKFVFIDGQGGRREEGVGGDRYVRLTVPPGYWFGFQGLSRPTSLVLNIADIPHDPDEVERMDIQEMNFDGGMVA